MGSIVFLPGILGSELFLGEEMVWPPTPIEAKLGYHRIDKLADLGVVAGDPIRSVLCFDIYRPILDDLADIASGNASAPKRSFHPMGYDWRRDLRATAEAICARIDALPPEDKDEIFFVGHSMGCLIIRLIIESGQFDERDWFASIKGFTALAGPHLGATTALVRVLAIEGTSGLSGADIKRLSAIPDYPALYQLLPAPQVAALIETTSTKMSKLDLYDDAVARRLGLDLKNLRKAAETHAIFARNKRPPHVEYVYLAGSANDTWLRIDLLGQQQLPRKGKDAGDGTVPLWSAVNPSGVHHAAPATHEEVFRSDQIRTLLYLSLGARSPARAFSMGGLPVLTIFAVHPIYGKGKPIDLMLVPTVPTGRLSGDILVSYHEGATGSEFQPFSQHALNYEGLKVEHLKVELEPPAEAGFYKVTFKGDHVVSERGAATFGVCDAGGAAGGFVQ